jgi:hypothetical protein
MSGQISSLPISIPLTFKELHERVSDCKKPTDLIQLGFPYLLKPSDVTFDRAIKSMIYPIQSYKDVTNSALLNLMIKIESLFETTKVEEKEQAKKIFWSYYKSSLNPDPKSTTLSLTFSSEAAKVDSSKVIIEQTPFDAIKSIENTWFKCSAQEKFYFLRDQMARAKTPQQQGELIHYILNFIALEKEVMEMASSFAEKMLNLFRTRRLFNQGKSTTINLSPDRVATVFKLSNKFNSEEFAFLINHINLFKFRFNKDNIEVVFQDDLDTIVADEYLNKLLIFELVTKDQQLKDIIKKMQCSIENQILGSKCKKDEEKIDQLWRKLDLLIEKDPNGIGCQATPFQIYTKLLHKRFFEFFSNKTYGSNEKDSECFMMLKSIHEYYLKYKKQQEDFYAFAWKTLSDLTSQQHKEIKKQFFRYQKNLTESTENKVIPNLPDNPFQSVLPSNKNEITPPANSQQKPDKSNTSIQPKTSSKSTQKTSMEDSLGVSIEVPKPQEKIQPEELPGTPFLYTYDQRVERWHSHSFGTPLSEDIFPEYFTQKPPRQQLMHVFHALNPLVDRFLHLAITSDWINKKNETDLWEVIPAEVSFKGNIFRGVISYCTDPKTKNCYHKFFSEMSDQKIVEGIVQKTFNANDFPDLQTSTLITKQKNTLKPKQEKDLKTSWVIDPIFGNVIIQDAEKNLTIKLFNTKPFNKKV